MIHSVYIPALGSRGGEGACGEQCVWGGGGAQMSAGGYLGARFQELLRGKVVGGGGAY